jgi:ATP-binding protein involved in chromosome partitioning
MNEISLQQIVDALEDVSLQGYKDSIVKQNLVHGIQIENGHVMFQLIVDPQLGEILEPMRQEAEHVVSRLQGVNKVTAILTAEKSKPEKLENKGFIEEGSIFKNIIAVASGKGGVGKSTVSSNLAVNLASKGFSVGLIDADIYGPSIPKMMGVEHVKPTMNNNKLDPIIVHGVKVISIGFLVDESKPVVWRGPMIQSALRQFMVDVTWQDLDYLIVDLPPGTGDAQITLSQKANLTGVVVVSTPQDISLIDAKKAVAMFAQLNVPIIGLIENMSSHICPECGHESHIFGHDGARHEAHRLGIDYLGSLPLQKDIRVGSDEGRPFMANDNEQAYISEFKNIVDNIIKSQYLT